MDIETKDGIFTPIFEIKDGENILKMTAKEHYDWWLEHKGKTSQLTNIEFLKSDIDFQSMIIQEQQSEIDYLKMIIGR